MKTANSLTDTVCLMAGVQPARHRRPGEQFEAGETPQPAYGWLWRSLSMVLTLLIIILIVRWMLM